MKNIKLKSLFAVMFALLLLFGCSNSNGSETAEPAKTAEPAQQEQAIEEKAEPVTLHLFEGQALSEENWNLLLHEPLAKKYPHITVNIVNKGNGIQDLIATGQQFDLYTEFQGYLGNFVQVDLLEDITPIAEKHGFDLSRFQPVAIDAIKEYSDPNELVAVPYFMQANALYYNKDIFDLFGVEYPKDGMFWEDVIELAKRMTRTFEGTNYYGLDPEHATRLAFPRSLVIVNGDTNTAEVNNEEWRKVFDLAKSIYSIPGNLPEKETDLNGGGIVRFMRNKNIAMLATIQIIDRLKEASDSGVNWDLVQYPSYPDQPNVSGMVDLHVIGITKTSKHKDEAMKVIEVFTSDEVQLLAARKRPAISPLNNPEMQSQFGAEVDYLEGKNKDALFKSVPAPAPKFSDYYVQARTILNNHYRDFILDRKDVNTALRDAEEEINRKIAELMGE